MFKFRPREGWRVFAGEVGVIVLGVLIALGAQQLADEWQWRQTVARTTADLDAQMMTAIIGGVERHAVDRCLSTRLVALAGKVAANRGPWRGDPYILGGKDRGGAGTAQYAIAPAYRSPRRAYPDDVWEQAKSAGLLSHMSPGEVANYAEVFGEVAIIEEQSAIEQGLATQISNLSFDGELNSTDRARALAIIAQIDGANAKILNGTRNLLGFAKKMGVRMSLADEKLFEENIDGQRVFRGPCVDKPRAEKMVAPLRRGAP